MGERLDIDFLRLSSQGLVALRLPLVGFRHTGASTIIVKVMIIIVISAHVTIYFVRLLVFYKSMRPMWLQDVV